MDQGSSTQELLHKIQQIEDLLRGNGKQQGLITQLALLQREQELISQALQEMKYVYQQLTHQVEEVSTKIQKLDSQTSHFMDFRFVLERIILPILIPLISTTITISLIITGGLK